MKKDGVTFASEKSTKIICMLLLLLLLFLNVLLNLKFAYI